MNIAAIIRSAAEHCDKYYMYGWMARSEQTELRKGMGGEESQRKVLALSHRSLSAAGELKDHSNTQASITPLSISIRGRAKGNPGA